MLGAHGIYSVIDLHALPGSQNQHWHSDNPTHVAAFWQHRHFQDRVVHLWEFMADRYRDNPWVAGYNPVNEPGDVAEPGRRAVLRPAGQGGPRRRPRARALPGRQHLLHRFHDLPRGVREHRLRLSRLRSRRIRARRAVPRVHPGEWVDRGHLERAFEKRTLFQRETGTPLWVGEFGPVYTGNPEIDAQRYRILRDQLAIYDVHDAGWSLWTYKDVGLQGVVHADPAGPYLSRFGAFIGKKHRLGADRWGSTMEETADDLAPLHRLMDTEAPSWNPYPWGARYQVDDLIRHILIAQALVPEYAELFRGLSEEELAALADSFALAGCVRREPLVELLTAGLAGRTGPGSGATS
ncbi:glycoside hydrolase family 5 protein [Streptosporangium lutulentum]